MNTGNFQCEFSFSWYCCIFCVIEFLCNICNVLTVFDNDWKHKWLVTWKFSKVCKKSCAYAVHWISQRVRVLEPIQYNFSTDIYFFLAKYFFWLKLFVTFVDCPTKHVWSKTYFGWIFFSSSKKLFFLSKNVFFFFLI